MNSIPKSLRPDTMTVRNLASGDYGGTYGQPFRVVGVRFEAAASFVRSDYMLSDGSAGLIYTDNSLLNITVGAEVTIKGNTYSVVKVSPFEAWRGKLHHYEIEVA